MVLLPEQTLAGLQSTHAQTGRLEWIGLRPGHRKEMFITDKAELIAEQGLNGDHYCNGKGSGKRGVTLIQAEYLPVIANLCSVNQVNPAMLRRNLVISMINIAVLKEQCFQIGEAILQGTGYCHPCSRMEETLGHGGYNAVRNHGGITARVLKGGWITIGDVIKPLQ